jgi:hypothetical protein
MELADQILAQDETCSEAWLIAMKCFQLLYPIEQYNAENELTCARYAIRFAPKERKYAVRKQVYSFLLTKVHEVLARDAEVLGDGRSILSFYQRTVYFDATHAGARTMEELFEAIPGSAIAKNAQLNAAAAEVAHQWQRTYSYLEMRYEMYHTTLSRSAVEDGLRQYARFLRNVKGRETLLATPVPFNIYRLDQTTFAE